MSHYHYWVKPSLDELELELELEFVLELELANEEEQQLSLFRTNNKANSPKRKFEMLFPRQQASFKS